MMDKRIKPEIKERQVSVTVDLSQDTKAAKIYGKLVDDATRRIKKRLQERRKFEYKAEKQWRDFVIDY